MPTEKKLTGYPSIDKPWLKYYTEEAINAKLPECTIYEYLLVKNKDHLEDVALVYFDKILTFPVASNIMYCVAYDKPSFFHSWRRI